MTDKRFVIPDGDLDTDITLIDMVTGIEYTDNFEDIVKLANAIWNQTLRFEKYNQELVQRSIKYEDKIDELTHENKRFKFILKEAIRTERTDMGRNVLKQLWEAIK